MAPVADILPEKNYADKQKIAVRPLKEVSVLTCSGYNLVETNCVDRAYKLKI
jgi:hypothetical protein